MRLTSGGLLLLGALAAMTACSSAAGTPYDAGVDLHQDAGMDAGSPDASVTPANAQASVVFIDGLVNGDATDTTGAALALDDVRVCIFDTGGNALTTYAQPDSTFMPFTNYPGVHRGGGVDLGSHSSFAVVVDVFSAADLAEDGVWSQSRTSYKCKTMACDQTSLPCQHHVSFPVTLVGGVNVVALVDKSGGGVTLAQRSFHDVTYNGTESSLYGTAVDFSGWHSGFELGAFYGNYVDGSGTVNAAISYPVDPLAPSEPKQIAQDITNVYDTLGVRFDAYSGGQPSDRFGQSLDSIAFVSNAAVTPPEFYGVRENFVFALVGDPNDPKSVQNDGGRDPAFDGKGLHIVAVPYATPLPL